MMHPLQAIQRQLQPSQGGGVAKTASVSQATNVAVPQPNEKDIVERDPKGATSQVIEQVGVAKIEAAQAIWTPRGKYVLWAGLWIMWFIFELDNATVYNYQNYATSEFSQISLLGTLSTAGTIVSAALKPPVAKTSDIWGRAETYCAAVLFYIVSYALCAASKTFNVYAAGYIIYCIGQTAMQILNQIIVADISSTRWRAMAVGIVNIPFFVVPWISAFIVDSALVTVGWRWGIGMFAIILPVCSLCIILPLLFFQRRAKQQRIILTESVTIYDFCSLIDLGGVILLCGGFALLLLPLSLASATPERWSTPWIPALMAVGAVLLAFLVLYEKFVAIHPVLPLRYFKNLSVVLPCVMGMIDAFAFSATHTYMYTWSTVVHDYGPRDSTFLTYTAGCVQALMGLIVGFILFKTRRYKRLLMFGTVVRVIGYGVMMRLRGATNSDAEIFIVQIIQGLGSGIVQNIILVAAQVTVPHTELALITSLVLLCVFLGNGIGSSVAGAIYTGAFKKALRDHLGEGDSVSANVVESAFNSISAGLPDWGTPERTAINFAYSDVMRYMTIAALVAVVPPLIFVWFLPNLRLNDSHNLASEVTETGKQKPEAST